MSVDLEMNTFYLKGNAFYYVPQKSTIFQTKPPIWDRGSFILIPSCSFAHTPPFCVHLSLSLSLSLSHTHAHID